MRAVSSTRIVKSSGNVFAPKTITWHLSGFIFRELILNQLVTKWHSFSIVLLISSRLSQHLNKVLSSAKLQISPLSINKNKSLLKMLNNKVPTPIPVELLQVSQTSCYRQNLFSFSVSYLKIA